MKCSLVASELKHDNEKVSILYKGFKFFKKAIYHTVYLDNVFF